MEKIFGYSFDVPWFFTNYSFLLVLGLFLMMYALTHPYLLGRKLYLILFSLFFYFKSSGPFLGIFVLLIICDYHFAQSIERVKNGTVKKALLSVSILLSLSFLLYFKYSGFFFSSMNELFGTGFHVGKLLLPIGISFYTFQSISYIVDVYQGKIRSSSSFVDYAFYMTFFPHLVAGPIVRASDFIPQINDPIPVSRAQMKESLFRIMLGMCKKLIIADFLARYVDMVHAQPGLYSGAENLICMYAYACQIYFDFSGYSDIAIGIALLMGYRLKENFDNPYRSQNITDFWRRWHMSLSSWLRDYVYIPLGGSRSGTFKTYLFLMITMTVGGIWHGASWNFIVWGIAQGVALVCHKLFFQKNTPGKQSSFSRFYNIMGIILTFHFVSLLWILFRAKNFAYAFDSINKIFFDIRFSDFIGFYMARKELVLMLFLSLFLIFMHKSVKQFLSGRFIKMPIAVIVILMVVIFQLVLQLRSSEIAPFIYFQF